MYVCMYVYMYVCMQVCVASFISWLWKKVTKTISFFVQTISTTNFHSSSFLFVLQFTYTLPVPVVANLVK